VKSYIPAGTDQISAEVIKAGGEILHSEINKIILSICDKQEMPQQRKESVILSIHKKDD